MIEKLSSAWTFYYKVVFPIVWITGFGLGTWFLWQVTSSQPIPFLINIQRIFLFVWLVGSGFILWLGLRLKTVVLNGQSLIIENYRQEITIPLSHIKEIHETKLINPKTITLHLSSPCAFGDRILFIPKIKFYNPTGQHPTTQKLKELIARA